MHEEFEKLMYQAGLLADGSWGDMDQYDQEAVAKFAKLIVRECMDCATWVGKTNTSPVEPIHTAHAINRRMRQHFGVE